MRISVWLLVLLVALCSVLASAAPRHPLAPLSEEELTRAATTIRAYKESSPNIRFVSLALHEPEKAAVLRFEQDGTQPPRTAEALLLDREQNATFQVVVDVERQRIDSWKRIPNVQPMVLYEEYDMVDDIVKADPTWQAAMKRRGINDTNDIVVDAWAAGYTRIPGNENARLLRALSYLRKDQNNFYGRPIEGVVAIVNMNTRTVVQVVDNNPLPLPPPSMQFDEQSNPPKRPPLPPLNISQQEKGFSIEDNEVRWQNWHFLLMLHPREGLVLSRIRYNDGGKERMIIHRLALSEMVVPYGDTSANWVWRNAFDVGEYGIGNLTFPMEANTDAPPNAQFLDAVFADNDGKPVQRKNVIAVYERDGGVLWKHLEQYSGVNQSRRARELVVSSIATVGNYDYAVNYIFREDGGIETEVNLTGIMLPKGVAEARQDNHDQVQGHQVAPHVVAPNHQHFFNFRIDFDVDGTANSFSELDAWAPPPGSRENMPGNAIVMDEVQLRHEQEARRLMSLDKARKWRIYNPNTTNSLGYPSAYIFIPGENSLPYVSQANRVRQRALFINHHIWATSYKATERYAAGDYPNQSSGGEGLPAFVKDNESIDNTDLVVWYTMGITHVPRPEEYPIMSAHKAGFKLMPAGFFLYNPSLDVRR